MSKNNAQRRAEKRNANTRKRAQARKGQKALHKKEEMYWENARELFDGLVDLTNQAAPIAMYLQDPLVAKHVNADLMIETLASMQYDVKTYIEPPMLQLQAVLKERTGRVKEEQIPEFIEVFQALLNVSEIANTGLQVKIDTAWTKLTRAVNAVKAELGVEEYVPDSIKKYQAQIIQRQQLIHSGAAANVH